MYNPLCLFTEPLLDALVKADKKYFVRQSYPRGFSQPGENIKAYFLLTHHAKLNEAKQHYHALIGRKERHLYDWENEEDRERLKKAVAQPEGYKIFAAVVMPDWKQGANGVLKVKLKKYIDLKLKWKPVKNQAVDFELYLNNGEVFVTLKLRNQQVKISLEEIENFI